MFVCVLNAFRQHFRPFNLFLLQKTLVSAQLHDSLGQLYRTLSLSTKSSRTISRHGTHAGVAGRWPGDAGRGGVGKGGVKGWDGVGTIFWTDER
jgi:hypothetical protein